MTLTGVIGGAARAPGQHMAVSESGSAIGSFSGGCVEAAVIAEALNALAAGQARLVRFGAGSRYIDIRLPCGGGIDLLFTPDPDQRQIDRAIGRLEMRRSVAIVLSSTGSLTVREAAEEDCTRWLGPAFLARHDPDLRLVVLGHGAEPMALIAIARAYGAQTLLLTPQTSLLEDARQQGVDVELLRTLGPSESLTADPWTAVVTLFHDHDWETALLIQALQQQPFFIGAMGSRKTHEERRRRLLDAHVKRDVVECVTGPVGLIAASRDPHTLAISIMAQVVQAFEASTDCRPIQPRRPIQCDETHSWQR
ncbi:XdhC family protein [Sphingomonas sp. AP4-R1]|uniref:XdhC family protein n=1 Tax=Sphingomonas sp. AP4-R1 TaxID=2735134 RepID=UPI0014935EC3|nr:XdhC family protein [Sphingomonas sp. AP4-R1]QJU58395.1 XdhC family protein [Sphingomonas sp. AP4-R1]